MEVKEAIEIISQLFNEDWDNDVDENGISYKKTREDFIALLKFLESENKKLDLEKRGLLLENKALKKENEAYKGIVEDVRDIILHHIGHLEPNEVLDIIDNTSNKYLGGGE
jgi:uncharacterized protein Smg (DUF494 family)